MNVDGVCRQQWSSPSQKRPIIVSINLGYILLSSRILPTDQAIHNSSAVSTALAIRSYSLVLSIAFKRA